jgi:hypothetical protein
MAAGLDTWEGAPSGAHPVLTALESVRAALTEAACSESFWSLSEAEVVAAVGAVLAVRSVTEAVTAALVGQVQTRGVYTQVAAESSTGWLRRRFGVSLTEARRLTALAAALPRWAQVEVALAQGRVSAEAAAAITTVLEALPGTASAGELTRAEGLLVDQAATLDPGELAVCGQALTEALTVRPDVDDPAEAERVAKDAEAREAGEWERRGLRLVNRRDGMVGITGALDPLSGALVREVLEAAARPGDAVDGVGDDRRPGQRLADALTELITTGGPLDLDQDAGMTTPPGGDAEESADSNGEDPGDLDDLDDLDDCESGDAGDAGEVGEPVLDFGDGFDPAEAGHDHRTGSDQGPQDACAGANRAHRRAHRCGTGHGTDRGQTRGRCRRRPPTARPGLTVSLVVDWALLRAGLAGGTLPDGTTLSPAATLAALCDAGIIPMVFDGPGLPLHVGRTRRHFTGAQRRALAARDRGCSFPGCRRRASCCAAHHLIHWEHGGPTDINNGALLCLYHHQLVHREGWEGRLDARGRPEYRPPATLDPHRRWRQHLRYATAT